MPPPATVFANKSLITRQQKKSPIMVCLMAEDRYFTVAECCSLCHAHGVKVENLTGSPTDNNLVMEAVKIQPGVSEDPKNIAGVIAVSA